MPSKLEKYTLIKTLGEGAYSKVKLALDRENGQYYAIKIHKPTGDKAYDKQVVQIVETEAMAIIHLNHANIINIVNYYPQSVVVKEDGTKQDVNCIIVEELASGGEMFYFLQNTGKFEDKLCRYFFR